jgi:hypothetical protein
MRHDRRRMTTGAGAGRMVGGSVTEGDTTTSQGEGRTTRQSCATRQPDLPRRDVVARKQPHLVFKAPHMARLGADGRRPPRGEEGQKQDALGIED